jgi:hypothetical protein
MFQEVLIARLSLVVVFIHIPRDWLIFSVFFVCNLSVEALRWDSWLLVLVTVRQLWISELSDLHVESEGS